MSAALLWPVIRLYCLALGACEEAAMIRVMNLYPGDLVTSGGASAVCIARTRHPLYPEFALVIWRLEDGTISLDALAPWQEVGELAPASAAERLERLERAIHETGNVSWSA